MSWLAPSNALSFHTHDLICVTLTAWWQTGQFDIGANSPDIQTKRVDNRLLFQPFPVRMNNESSQRESTGSRAYNLAQAHGARPLPVDGYLLALIEN